MYVCVCMCVCVCVWKGDRFTKDLSALQAYIIYAMRLMDQH